MKLHYIAVLFVAFLIMPLTIFPQVVVTVPEVATQNDSITILFDATEGDQGLMGFNGTVYAHTGVITNRSTSSSDWKNVVGQWGNNNTQPALTRIGTDLYELVIGFPRQFYSLTDPTEEIQQLAFVFRSPDGGTTGRDVGGGDIFAQLFVPGLSVIIETPTVSTAFGDLRRSPVFGGLNDTIPIRIRAVTLGTEVDSLSLWIDGDFAASAKGDSLAFDFETANYPEGFTTLYTSGVDTAGIIDSTSFLILVQPEPTGLAPPPGVVPGINYHSSTSATLALFAPEKEFVYLIGDFEDWLVDTRYNMNRHITANDSILWWLTLEGLTPGEEYAFQYLVDGLIRIGDPYTEKVLDPWNDEFIPEITYLNLKPYPEGKTGEPVSILQTEKPEFTWQYSDDFQRPAKEDLVIYELLVRDFIARHDFETMIDTLDYLERLGINAIELMPFNEFEGNSSWGYNPSFYFAPDKYYGTEDALKRFIDECHRRGIAVIMDIVLQHSYGQAPLVRLYWNEDLNRPAANSPWFNEVSPNPVFSFGYDFNHESVHTEAFTDRVNLFWLQEYRIDGYRFDFTKGFTNRPGDGSGHDATRIAILQRMADVIWEHDSTTYVILEHFAQNSEERVLAEYRHGMMLWGNSNFNYNEATMGYHDGGKSDFSWGYYKTRGWNQPGLVTYMESHDEERLMFKNLQFGNSSGNYNVKELTTALDRIKLAAAFFLTIPGPKMIWQFGELGYDISINDPCRVCEKPILWQYWTAEEDRQQLYQMYRTLINLRQENEVFRSTDTDVDLWLNHSSGRKRIKLSHSSMNASIIGNFGVVNQDISANFQHTGWWYDYFSGDSIDVTDINQNVNLNPGAFLIFTDMRLEPPDSGIVVGIKDRRAGNIPGQFALHQNYPNPFNPETIIPFDVAGNEQVKLAVFNVLGQQVRVLVNESLSAGTYRARWDGRNDAGETVSSGIFFVRMTAGEFVHHRRMILLR